MNDAPRRPAPTPVVALVVVLVGLVITFGVYFARESKLPQPATQPAAAVVTAEPTAASPVEAKPATIRTPEAEALPSEASEASDTDAPPRRNGSVKLRVVMSGTREPVAGLSVTLAPNRAGRNVFRNGVQVLRAPAEEGPEKRGATDGAGILALDGLAEGSLVVTVDDDFLFVSRGATVEASAVPPTAPVDVTVRRGGKITGRVTSASGEPVAGVAITMNRDFSFSAMTAQSDDDDEEEWISPPFMYGSEPAPPRTDASGLFAVRGVPPQKAVVLQAVHPDYAPAQSEPVSVKSGEESTAAPIVLSGGGTLVVHVRGGDGKPVTDASVQSGTGNTPNTRTYGSWGKGKSGNVSVDAEGTARLLHQPTGKRMASVESPTHATATIDDIDIVVDQTTEKTVTLSDGLTIDGLVVDENGKGILGAQGSVWGQEVGQRHFTTDADGKFHVAGLNSTPVRARVTAQGYTAEDRVRLTPGATDARIVMKKGASISGRVVLANGDPAKSFQVTAWTSGGAGAFFGADMMPRTSESFDDPEGRFTLASLTDGNYTLRAHAKSKGSGESTAITLADSQSVEGVVITLAPDLTVHGRVVDGSTRDPVSGASVSFTHALASPVANQFLMNFASPAGDAQGARSANDGSFTLAEVPANARALVAAKKGFLPARVEPLPAAGADGTCDVEIALSRGGTVMGTVRDASGAPSAGAGVIIRSGFMPAGTGKSRADGAYSISGIEPGTYTIGVAIDEEEGGFVGGLRDSVSVTVGDGETVRVDLGGSARTGCRIHGKVLIDDHPAPGVRITLIDVAAKNLAAMVDQRTTTSNDSGEYEFANVARGRFTIGGETEGTTVFANVTVAAEPDLRVDLVAPRGSLAVLVVDAKTNESIPSMEVVVTPTRPAGSSSSSLMDLIRDGVWQETTGADGRAEFRHLPAGTFDVSVGVETFRLGAGDATYANERVEVAVAETGQASIQVRLQPGVALEGKVSGPDGQPVPRPSVTLLDDAGRSMSGLFTIPGEADGQYRVSGLKPGVYVARVSASGFAPLRKTGVRVTSAKTSHADFALGLGGSASVLVVDTSSSAPVSGATIEWADADGNPLSEGIDFLQMMAGGGNAAPTETDASGRLVREHLSPGAYTVTASDGAREGRASVTVREGQIAEVRVELK